MLTMFNVFNLSYYSPIAAKRTVRACLAVLSLVRADSAYSPGCDTTAVVAVEGKLFATFLRRVQITVSRPVIVANTVGLVLIGHPR